MALQANYQVAIEGADKTRATALAIEFWTGKGFTVHSSSYNCIILRRNGYGSIGKLLGSLFTELAGQNDIPWDRAATELTVLCQVLPKTAKWDLSFKLAANYSEKNPGDFSRICRSWCDEFAAFCREWMDESGE